ncbi:MAG: cation-translocating P-type ATPase [Hyphomicrobium sp.]
MLVQGLTDAEAAFRLKAHGPNEIPRTNRRTDLRILLEVVREPMLSLLILSGLIYFLLGELQDALILVLFCCISIIITVIQEVRTEHVLEALRNLTSPRALVIRNGLHQRIPGREVVLGDVIILGEGDRVPADAELLESHDFEADESLLTGESVPVSKFPSPKTSIDEKIKESSHALIFSGTLVVRGSAKAIVKAIGAMSEIGKIAHSLGSLEVEPPHLKLQMNKFVRIFALLGGSVSLLAILLYGLLRQGWMDAFLGGIAIGMSLLPEEFPMVLTIFMAMGAWRISKARVLTRRAAAIETLGSATALCTDKTGTLTENKMSIKELILPNGESLKVSGESTPALTREHQELLNYGVLACAQDAFDPMEKAFHELSVSITGSKSPLTKIRLVQIYGLRSNLLAVTHVWHRENSDEYIIASKGAPEAIAELCNFDKETLQEISFLVDEMARRGLRVIAVARGSSQKMMLPQIQQHFKMTFLGLVGLADPLRKGVPEAMLECQRAGVKVFMITGDYPATASAIAKEAGFPSLKVITGKELQKLSDAELVEISKDVQIFARVMPDQKLKIVRALKEQGAIVAMTGDGVNDAPSLKAAHIGIAMGGRGTDVAREASSLVLLDDDFNSIVKTIKLGRRIYDNLKKASAFIFAVHIPIAGLALFPLLFGLPIILSPIHIAFLEMFIDPVCSLVFEAEKEERDIMLRPPRSADSPLFSTPLIKWSLIQGFAAFLAVAVIFTVGFNKEMPTNELRALVFFSLVTSIVALMLVNRSFSPAFGEAFFKPSVAMILVTLAVFSILTFSVLLPFGQEVFRFGPLHTPDIAVTLITGVAIFIILEFLKVTKVHL